jgi:hypothetical protein
VIVTGAKEAHSATFVKPPLCDPLRGSPFGGLKPLRDVIRKIPARLLTPDERALVAEWFAAAGDFAEAYVSNRRADDPALYRRIVIVTKPGDAPSYLVHAPSGRHIWIVFSLGRRTKIKRFQSLRAALNSICPALVDAASADASSNSRMT